LTQCISRHTYASVRTTMNLASDVRTLLRQESERRGSTMTSLLEAAVRTTYGSKSKRFKRRLVRKNGYVVVAALPGERSITDARVKDILQQMEW
jgi:hypothetical protein